MAQPVNRKMRFQFENCLVYCNAKAVDSFWDEHWSELDLEKLLASPRSAMVESVTQHYLPQGSLVIEGGCGPALTVEALRERGYLGVGIDFASKTLHRVKRIRPEAILTEGDVFSLPFKGGVADGYWSLGVIEHFIEGYAPIINEAARVVKPGGLLFLTFPYMSPLRRLKVRLSLFPRLESLQLPDNLEFYQFALPQVEVTALLRQSGFTIITSKPYDGLKGLKDEVTFLSPLLGKIYNSNSVLGKIVRRILNILTVPFSGHILLIVAKRN